MKHNFYSLFLTAAIGMWGMQAWAQDTYEIGSAADLVSFAEVVNNGATTANAILTADIDCSSITEWVPIGNSGDSNEEGKYHGTFDGQGHTIKNLNINMVGGNAGLFNTTAGVTLKNFIVDSSCSIATSGNCTGVVGRHLAKNVSQTSTFSGIGNAANVSIAASGKENPGGLIGGCWGKSGVDIIIENCWTSGTITSSQEKKGNCGAFIGWLNGGNVSLRNCWTIATVNTASADKYLVRPANTNMVSFSNCYSLNGGQVNKLTAEDLANGSLCYSLNGDQTTINWFQTLGTDATPVLDATHSTVYATGTACPNGYRRGVTYSNSSEGEIIIQPHEFDDGFCSYCSYPDEDYMQPNDESNYELGTAHQLKWFAAMVNNGWGGLCAVLKNDIDLSGVDWTPIGDSNNGFTGTFDGQGHAITNFAYVATRDNNGLFGYIDNATVKNFRISGEMTSDGFKYNGLVGQAEGSSVVSGIYSNMNINVANCSAHSGGIVGGCSTSSKIFVEGCEYAGTFTHSGTGDCQAGILGYTYAGGVKNCIFSGTINGLGDTKYGGILGYCKIPGFAGVQNCLSIGKIVATKGNRGAIIANWNGDATKNVKNNYYRLQEGSTENIPAIGNKAESCEAPIKVTDAELESGEITWKLNNEKFIDVVWHQTVGEDLYPTLQADRGIVYLTSNGYQCVSRDDESSIYAFRDYLTSQEADIFENTVAQQSLLDAYSEAIEAWGDIEDLDELFAAYQATFELKDQIKKSAASYSKYIEACQAALTTLTENSVEGTWADFLYTYLQEDVEPNSDYPNGSYVNILDKCELDEEALAEEIAFVEQMLQNAIAGGITAGTEITRLMPNSNFAQGFEGWTTETDGISFGSGGHTDIMPIVRGLGKGTFSVSQTLTELPNGIYMVVANGMFRTGDDYLSKFTAGQLYLNGTSNFIMSPGEDVVLTDDAEDKVNCDIENDLEYLDDVVGYVPKGIGGCSYAFSAGRYKNFCATEITDGTLTVGVRSLGTGLNSDWLPFGNIRVWYLGSADEAEERLTEVLEGYIARAQTISESLVETDEEENKYNRYPNMSESLKEQIVDAIAEASAAVSGEEKMASIYSLSALFNEIYACRRAYIDMLRAAYSLKENSIAMVDAGLISEDVWMDCDDEASIAIDHYTYGDVSTEEALAITKALNDPNKLGLPINIVDGVIQLATVDDVQLFSEIVNYGYNNAKVVLTNDIDMSEVEGFHPIGSEGAPFMGEFDGQDHKIIGFTLNVIDNYQGFFGYIKNAEVKNFSIDGTITVSSEGNTGMGAIGYAVGSTISNVHSALNIIVEQTSKHIGGVCGHLHVGSTARGCSFSGTIDEKGNSHDCIGGIAGYSNEYCLYENCVNYGTIKFVNKGAYASGICGYVNNEAFYGIYNCLNVGTIATANGQEPTYAGAIVGRLRAHTDSVFVNNYMLEGSAARAYGENAVKADTITAAQLASGEICYRLNGDQTNINWYQTLGKDSYPVLFDSHKVVLYSEADGYYNEGGNSITGDLNGDNKVDIADAVTVLNIMAASEYNEAADVNNDKKVDIADFVTILNIMAAQ